MAGGPSVKMLAAVATLGPYRHLPDPPLFPDVETRLIDELKRHYSADVTVVRRGHLASPQTTVKAITTALSQPGDVLLLTVHAAAYRFARAGNGWALAIPGSLHGRRRSMLRVEELMDAATAAANGRPLLICLDAMPPQAQDAPSESLVDAMSVALSPGPSIGDPVLLVSAMTPVSDARATVRHGLWQALTAVTATAGDDGEDIYSIAASAAAIARQCGADALHRTQGAMSRLVPTLPSYIRFDLFSADETSRIDAAVELARMATAGDKGAATELGLLAAHDLAPQVRDYAKLQIHPVSQPSLPELSATGKIPEGVQDAARKDLYLPDLLPHPGGLVTIGVDAPSGQPADRPRHTLDLAPFHLGRTPVTNREYLAYVIATGAHCPDHWAWEEDLWDEDADLPVVNVSFHDALRYCDWLTGHLHDIGRLPLTARIVLPSEVEWEAAAGNGRGDRHPWGPNPDPARTNIRASGFGRPTPVGSFAPAGNSISGCEDLIGNVWEWTRSTWGTSIRTAHRYPYDARDGREDPDTPGARHVVRGGAFYYATECANSHTRNQMPHESRHPGGGFRVAAQGIGKVTAP